MRGFCAHRGGARDRAPRPAGRRGRRHQHGSRHGRAVRGRATTASADGRGCRRDLAEGLLPPQPGQVLGRGVIATRRSTRGKALPRSADRVAAAGVTSSDTRSGRSSATRCRSRRGNIALLRHAGRHRGCAGRRCGLRELVPARRSSSPPQIDGDHYIDGGMTETLALRIGAEAREADLVIGVDLSLRGDLHEFRRRIARVAAAHPCSQTYEVMGTRAQRKQPAPLRRRQDVVLVKPKVSAPAACSTMPDVSGDRAHWRARGDRGADDPSAHALSRATPRSSAGRRPHGANGAARSTCTSMSTMNACIHCGICAATCATRGLRRRCRSR